MKAFSVIVTPQAEAGIREAFLYIYSRAPLNAERWLKQLYAEIRTLETLPERCACARERDYLEQNVRQLIFKSHRVVFYVDNSANIVYVLHVRHASRQAVGQPRQQDLPDSDD